MSAAVADSLTKDEAPPHHGPRPVALVRQNHFAGSWRAHPDAINDHAGAPGGAVTAAVLVLFIIPPLAVQLVPEAISWVPGALVAVLSGVSGEVGLLAAMAVVAAWAIIPAALGLLFVQRRDVV